MLMSFYRYGKVAEAYPDKINALDSLQQRIKKYRECGNIEFLIDAANFAMIEFMHPSIPNAFFEPTDCDESPGRISKETGAPTRIDNNGISNKEYKYD